MTPRRRAAAALAAVLVLVSAGCGGDPQESYCDALKSEQKAFSEMQEDTSGLGLLHHRSLLHRLADEAPDDLQDEWQTLLGALDAFAETLDEIGVEPDDFAHGQPPAGLSEADRTRIANAASELSAEDVVVAADGIEQHAKDVCKLQLGL